jgi:vancomycin resistance protein YoaR
LVVNALRSGAGTPVDLPLKAVEPERTLAEAQALGVSAPIGSFTTNYAAGQSRVTNIHRIADLVRGVVIEPGQTFSVNGHVGARTAGKGFALGGFINQGVLEEAIGGGVSQFATTLFNAAFFGGLDFEEYQSHSLYISRYPYGREATLSFPKPDLILKNSTPYGVLVWTSYTDSSVTVTLYSTSYATGDQTGQSKSQSGNCTRVTTQRTRTYVDGRTEVDSVFATYRPAEGVNC